MNIFKRLLRIGQAEINSIIENMEDPIATTEQGICEMKEDLGYALELLAQAKAAVIRTNNEKVKKEDSAHDYENKAVLLLTKAHNKEIEMAQAERLAKEALALKDSLLVESAALKYQQVVNEAKVAEIQKDVETLRFNITKWENELKTLKSKVRINQAMKEVNRQMSQIDNNSTIDLLVKMKEKVEEEEVVAQVYRDMKEKVSVDDQINNIIKQDKEQKIENDLEEIKRKLGIE